MPNNETYDVVVLGGGAAGLSAATALARARRAVLVLDDGTPRNAPAGHVHNYLGREGTPPAELLAAGRAEVEGYGAEVRHARVTSVRHASTGSGFTILLADGGEVSARRLLVATGLTDVLPDVPGLAERWGRDVLHCPYCHGYEVRDQPVAVLATSPFAVHQALLFRQLTDDVTVLLHTAPELSDDDREQLGARGIRLVRGEVDGLLVTGDDLSGVCLRSGGVVSCRAVVVAPRFEARADVLRPLGLGTTDLEMSGHVLGRAVPADATGATAVPGVWVAGNVTDLRAQVVVSAAAGLTVGAAINADLVMEDVRDAVARMRAEAQLPV